MIFIQINCFIKRKNMTLEKKLRITINSYKKLLSSYPNGIKTSIEIIYTKFFAVATLEGLCLFSRQIKTLVVYFDPCESSLEDQINTVCKK